MAAIIIVEDHPFVREGVKSHLERNTPHDVVAECSTGIEALNAVRKLIPDLLIIDLRLPEMDGLEVIRRVNQEFPLLKIIVLSMHSGGAYVTRAIRHGAQGYILKSSDISDLSTAVESVLGGGRFFSPGVSSYVSEDGQLHDQYDDLTSREREVLQLVAEGKTAPDIKDILFISVRTVEKHRSNLMKKLGLHSHSEVIRYALQRGLIPLVDPGSTSPA